MRQTAAAAVQPASGQLMTPRRVTEALAAMGGAELVVLPEIAHVPYFPLEPDSPHAADAVALDSPLVDDYRQVAKDNDCHLVLSLYLEESSGRANAVVLIDPSGQLLSARTSRGRHASRYRKVHLCDVQAPDTQFSESAYFEAGDEYACWDTDLGIIGVLTCYDRHFSDAWRTLRAMRTEIMCVPTTSPARVAPTFVPELQAMALQHNVFVACANRVGRETLTASGRTAEFLGSSCIIGPSGVVLASSPGREDSFGVRATLEPDDLIQARKQSGLESHRRPDTYRSEGLVAPVLEPAAPSTSLSAGSHERRKSK